MKFFFILFLSGGCGLVGAQTNTPTQKQPEQQVDIHSDSAHFDGNTRQMIYLGRVLATDNVSALLRCGQLTFNLPAVGDHPTNVVAESKIMINYRDEKNVFYHITAARAVYDYHVVQSVTNELVTLTGSPKVEWGDANQLTGVTNLLAEDSDSLTNALPNWLIGEPIYYARVNGGKGSFQANHQQIHIEPHTSGTNTSPMPAKLF